MRSVPGSRGCSRGRARRERSGPDGLGLVGCGRLRLGVGGLGLRLRLDLTCRRARGVRRRVDRGRRGLTGAAGLRTRVRARRLDLRALRDGGVGVRLRPAELLARLRDLGLGGCAVALALGGRQRGLRVRLGLPARLLLGLGAGTLLGGPARGVLGLLARAVLLGAEGVGALGDVVADRARDDVAGADRVVVARHDEVDAVGVAVRVDQADDRDAQALGLAHGDRLGLEVDDEAGVRRALHVLDAAQVEPQLGEVGLCGHALARRQQLELTLGLVALEIVQAADALVDRLEVREQAAEPAVVDVRHAGALGDLLDGVARLLLRADEEDGAAAAGELGREVLRLREQPLRLQQVDDVDAAALAVDEAAHLRVPAARLMAEVDPGLQQLLDADLGRHVCTPLFVCDWCCAVRNVADPVGDARWSARTGQGRHAARAGR